MCDQQDVQNISYIPSSSSSLSVDCERELNRSVIGTYDQTLEKEDNFLVNTIWISKINRFLKVHCGLSYVRNFQPAIKIEIHPNMMLSFNINEWNALITTLNILLKEEEYFKNKQQRILYSSYRCTGDLNIYLNESDMLVKTATIYRYSSNFMITLQEADLCDLVNISENFVNKKVSYFNHIDFYIYYHNFLYNVKKTIMYQACIDNNIIKSVITNFCEAIPADSLKHYFITECINFVFNKMLQDIEHVSID